MQRYFLCLDQGGSSSRAIVFDRSGKKLCESHVPVASQRPRSGWVEQDPGEVVDSLRLCCDRIAKQLGDAQLAQVAAAGLVTQRSSMVCWNESTGQALTPIISWQDVRAAGWLEAQQWPVAEIRQRTGLRLNAHFGVSKMRWCLDHMPAVAQAAANNTLLMAPLASFLLHELLAERPWRVDPANASRTLLMNLTTLDWDDSLLSLAGIEKAWLPAIVASDAVYGSLPLAGRSVPLRLLNGDQSAAAFAAGMPAPNTRYINVGTGAFVYQPIDAPVAAGSLLSSIILRHDQQRSRYVIEGTVNGAGAAVNEFGAKMAISDLSDAIARAMAIAEPRVLYLNGVGGLGSPDWRSSFASRFIGHGSMLENLRAILESIVFLLQRNMAEMDHLLGPVETLVISGGLSQSDGFCQCLSDLSALPVERLQDPEASARGAAFLLAGQPGDWQAPDRERFMPADNPALTLRYRSWSQAMAAALAV